MAERPSKADLKDQRHDKSAADVARRAPAKKDTKKWCKGKVGAEHAPRCEVYKGGRAAAMTEWREYVCQKCRKVLAYYMPVSRLIRREKPAWVTL